MQQQRKWRKVSSKILFYRESCIFQTLVLLENVYLWIWILVEWVSWCLMLAYLYSTKQSASSGFIYSKLCNTLRNYVPHSHIMWHIHVTYLLHTQQDKYYKLVQYFFAYSHLFQYFFTFNSLSLSFAFWEPSRWFWLTHHWWCLAPFHPEPCSIWD